MIAHRRDNAGMEAGAVGKTENSKQTNSNPNGDIFPARLQEADPLLGWFGLAAGVKQSKLRQMKRGWQRKGGR